jgi:hypothetical protein
MTKHAELDDSSVREPMENELDQAVIASLFRAFVNSSRLSLRKRAVSAPTTAPRPRCQS